MNINSKAKIELLQKCNEPELKRRLQISDNWPVLFSDCTFEDVAKHLLTIPDWECFEEKDTIIKHLYTPGTAVYQMQSSHHGMYSQKHDFWGMFHPYQGWEMARETIPGKTPENRDEEEVQYMQGIGNLLFQLADNYSIYLPRWETSKMDFKNVSNLVHNVESALSALGIDVFDYFLDHAAYRTESMEEYFIEKEFLASQGVLLGGEDKIISDRPIATYKLDKPIVVGGREIYVIELPAPKKGSNYSSGFEHVEYVVPGTLDEFRRQYNNIEFGTKGLTKEKNRDITLQFDGFAVKFHEQSLEDVIKYEQS